MRVDELQVPKAEMTPDECQDASCVREELRRFAVADGVTQSVFAKEWAKVIANGACDMTALSGESLYARLDDWRREWAARLPAQGMPWYVARKLREVGAYSTLAVLELGLASGRGYFKVLALGDTCVFQARGDRLIYAYPYTRPSQFSNCTEALGSWPSRAHDESKVEASVSSGERRTRDRFMLASDALAQYLLTRVTVGDEGIRAAMPFRRTHGDFGSWVTERRLAGDLRDDDTTLVDIRT